MYVAFAISSHPSVLRLSNQENSRHPWRFPDLEHWIENLPDIAAILGRAIWRFTFLLKDGRFNYTYAFRKIPGLNLDSRTVSREGGRLRLPPLWGGGRLDKKVVADVATTRGIGPLSGEFHVFDRRPKSASQVV